MQNLLKPFVLGLAVLSIPYSAVADSYTLKNNAEHVIIYGMKDLELEMEKKNPRLDYLTSRLNQVEAAIGIYGEDGYQLSKGKHAFRYKSIRENAESLISILEKEAAGPKNFGESVARELENGCMETSKKILVNDICGAKVDKSKRYDSVFGKIIVMGERLEREYIYNFLMNVDPMLKQAYEGMDPRSMREAFESQRDDYLKNLVAKKPSKKNGQRGVGDLEGYALLNNIEGGYGDSSEEFIYECIGVAAQVSNSYKQSLIDSISSDAAEVCGPKYSKDEISHLNSREGIEKQLNESIERLKVLEPIGEYEDIAHRRAMDPKYDINKIQDDLADEARKEMGERIFY